MQKLALAFAVLTCAGCVVSSGPNRPDELHQEFKARQEVMATYIAAARADKAAGRTNGVTAAATITYWLGIKSALTPLPINPEVVARTIDHQPTLGVDPELVIN